MDNYEKYKKQLPLAIMGSLTLGLAPFIPHAHIWKQITNLWYGRSMTGMDWFDLLMHGAPWIYLIYVSTMLLKAKRAIKN